MSRLLNDLRQDIPKRVIRLLAFEMKVIAAIAAGIGISLVVTVLAAVMIGFILSSLQLEHYASWAVFILQLSAIAIGVMASFKVYRYLEQRPSSPHQPEIANNEG